MIKFDEWHLPEGETHLPELMGKKNVRVDGRLTYQYHKYELAQKWIKDHRLAIDIGSHVGLWAYYMARDFQDVACFEPMPEHQMCWHLNMADKTNAELFTCALGRDYGKVGIETRTKGSSGDTGICQGDYIDMKPLDHFNFDSVDFIKIDCEGYEMHVLEGAVETLLRCKPTIIVEQKGFEVNYGLNKAEAVHFLESLGAKKRAEYSGDFVLAWA